MRTVIITGGSKGLGECLVKRFLADPEFNVVACARKPTPFIESIEASPDAERFWFSAVDIADTSQVAPFVSAARKRFGSIDILINNAAVAIYSVLGLQASADIDNMIDTNIRGTIAMTRACGREMLRSHWGRIINVTSIVGKTGYRGLTVYSITKAGLDGFTRGLAREFGARGITVNSVAPGFLYTEMTRDLDEDQRRQIVRRTPAGRLGQSEDVAPLIAFLCSDDAAFISGQTICIDGGLTS